MKKFFVMMACAALVLGFTGCKEKTDAEKAEGAVQELKKDAEKAGEELKKDAEAVKKDAAKKLDDLTK